MGFADQVAAFSAKTQAKLETAVRKIALDVFKEVILMSPVDEGTFRGNWQCAIGNIPAGTLEIDDKTGTATISKVEAEVLKLEVGQTIYLINNLPYAQKLEFGHSKQAPAGMVRITVQRWQPIVDAVAQQLSKE